MLDQASRIGPDAGGELKHFLASLRRPHKMAMHMTGTSMWLNRFLAGIDEGERWFRDRVDDATRTSPPDRVCSALREQSHEHFLEVFRRSRLAEIPYDTLFSTYGRRSRVRERHDLALARNPQDARLYLVVLRSKQVPLELPLLSQHAAH